MALSITAVLTVLSSLLIQRSVVEQKLSGQAEEAARALNLAEAGVEELLSDESILAGTGTLDAGKSYSVTKSSELQGVNIAVGRTRDIEITDATNFRFGWGGNAGMLMTVLGENGVKRYLFDRNGVGGISGTPDATINAAQTKMFNDFVSPAVRSEIGPLKIVRFKALVDNATLNVDQTVGLDSQAVQVEVEAETETGATSNVFAEKSAPQLPSVFDYALFSGDAINK